MGDWRSGSAAALQAEGHRFKSCIAHHETQNQTSSGFFCLWWSGSIYSHEELNIS